MNDTRDVLVRQWASGVIHSAQVPSSLIYEATIIGSVGEIIDEPVVTACRRTPRAKPTGIVGDCIIVMRPDQLTCRTCSALTGQPTRQQVANQVASWWYYCAEHLYGQEIAVTVNRDSQHPES